MIEPTTDANGQSPSCQLEFRPPLPSRVAAGCLAVPSAIGALLLLLAGMDAMTRVINWVVGAGTVANFPLHLASRELLAWGWSLACLLTWRFILGNVRKPWLYWMIVLCLAWGVLTTALTIVMNIPVFEQRVTYLEWVMCSISVVIFVWFSFSRRNRQYYHASRPS